MNISSALKLQQNQAQALSMLTNTLNDSTNIFQNKNKLKESKLQRSKTNPKFQSAKNTVSELFKGMFNIEKLKVEQEKIEPKWTDELSSILNNVLYTFKYQAFAKEIDLSLHCQLDLPDVYWDLNKIYCQILNNLVANSLQFTHVGGKIKIYVYAEKQTIIFKISDNGLGIPFSERKKFLEQFEKIDIETEAEKNYDRTALRLYNASLFIKQHGGTIKIGEGLENKGASFIIRLPVVPFKLLNNHLLGLNFTKNSATNLRRDKIKD